LIVLNNKGTVILVVIVFLFTSVNLSAQKHKVKNESTYDEKWFHFGFSLGLNTMDFNITPSQTYLALDSLYPEVSKLTPGINIQIVTNLKLNKYMDLRFLPGVSFGQRVIMYYKNNVAYKYDYQNVAYNGQQKIESSFLEFPLLLKYKGERLNNIRPYVIAGLNYRYDLAAKNEFDPDKPVFIRLKRPDLYYELGAGFDFYLTYFKLSIELKMSNGLGNVIAREAAPGYTQFYNAIDKMKSQIWILAFHFE
jgi:hypothetical protein